MKGLRGRSRPCFAVVSHHSGQLLLPAPLQAFVLLLCLTMLCVSLERVEGGRGVRGKDTLPCPALPLPSHNAAHCGQLCLPAGDLRPHPQRHPNLLPQPQARAGGGRKDECEECRAAMQLGPGLMLLQGPLARLRAPLAGAAQPAEQWCCRV